MSACADLLDAIIEEVKGRRIRVRDRWLIDFASCDHLGLDLDREVIEAIPAYLTQRILDHLEKLGASPLDRLADMVPLRRI